MLIGGAEIGTSDNRAFGSVAAGLSRPSLSPAPLRCQALIDRRLLAFGAWSAPVPLVDYAQMSVASLDIELTNASGLLLTAPTSRTSDSRSSGLKPMRNACQRLVPTPDDALNAIWSGPGSMDS